MCMFEWQRLNYEQAASHAALFDQQVSTYLRGLASDVNKDELTLRVLGDLLRGRGFDASVSVLKAVVTQASAAIPAMPLYLAVLFKVRKQHGSHEGCIEQIHRLFTECLAGMGAKRRDAAGAPKGRPAR